MSIECFRYKVHVRYNSISHEVLEMFIPTINIAFYHVNTIIGRTIIITETDKPRNKIYNSVMMKKETVDNIFNIHEYKKKILSMENEINEDIEAGLYFETVFFEKGPDIEYLKKEVLDITGYSKSKINSMTLEELKEIVNLVDDV